MENFSLESIKNLGKYFMLCDSISDVLFSLEPSFQDCNKKKLVEQTNQLNLVIPLNHPLCPQVIFNIKKKKEKFQNQLINYMK